MSNTKRLGSIPKNLSWLDDALTAPQQSGTSKPPEAGSHTGTEGMGSKVTAQDAHAQNDAVSTQESELILNETSLFETAEITPSPASARAGLPKGWTRATLIVKEEHLRKLKAIAYWDRLAIKEVVAFALDKFFEGKKVRAVPTRRAM